MGKEPQKYATRAEGLILSRISGSSGFIWERCSTPWLKVSLCPGEVLTLNTLSLERQRQLLGADPNDHCTDINNIPFCTIFKSCLADIRECCERGMKGEQKIAAVFSLQRQDALLGLDCISQTEAQEVIDLCSSNVWSGTFSMSETGSRVISTNIVSAPGSSAVSTITSEYSSHFDGAIERSLEVGSPKIGFSVDLRVGGELVQRDFHRTTYESTSAVERCPGRNTGGIDHGLQLEQTEHTTAAKSTYSVSFIIQPGGNGYELFSAQNFDPDSPDQTLGRQSNISFQSDDSPCSGVFIVKDFTKSMPGPSFASALPDAHGTMTNPNVVFGTWVMDDPAQDPPR